MRLAAIYIGLVISGLALLASINMGWKPPAAPRWDQQSFVAVQVCFAMVVLMASLGLSSLLPSARFLARFSKAPQSMVFLSSAMLLIGCLDLTPHSTLAQILGDAGRALAIGMAAAVPISFISSFESPDERGMLQISPSRGHALLLTFIGLTSAAGLIALYAR